MKTFDAGLWITVMMTQAHCPPVMTDDGFYMECYDLVRNHFGLDLGSEITSSNCIPVHQYLVANA